MKMIGKPVYLWDSYFTFVLCARKQVSEGCTRWKVKEKKKRENAIENFLVFTLVFPDKIWEMLYSEVRKLIMGKWKTVSDSDIDLNKYMCVCVHLCAYIHITLYLI